MAKSTSGEVTPSESAGAVLKASGSSTIGVELLVASAPSYKVLSANAVSSNEIEEVPSWQGLFSSVLSSVGVV